MLSYRHAFHAGNHADVLKHLAWLGVISHLKRKTKPFVLFDTHAGAGQYALDSEQAMLNREYDSGIARLDDVEPASALLSDYMAIVQPMMEAGIYPGSPGLAARAMRAQDAAHMMELHPAEFPALQSNLASFGSSHGQNGSIHLHHRDGLEGLIAMTPPTPNRGAILIDPPYEVKDEYGQVKTTLTTVLQRWQNAQAVVWYPLLSERAKEKAGLCQEMVQDIAKLGKNCFKAELTVTENTPDAGMYGSGVCIINPAWQLDEHLTQAMKEACLAIGPDARFSLQWLKQEAS
ncbi:23S rRNA (adenine(2030)-N(6))-methyltransferase RlmJ [Salinimonas sp. HHU 13199]|uniref:Ribosomal RNA large subunit methyltransferase J n=1 Tax=Salinimonas profundi TaxID=2729140 RepID=A0ABR8LH18_9ALTE|nr:23S rRNA (adenine(2030)-N(6))-methyltransferase RlmJ [Salinimonas profundi]MBD3584503.1 23S rRNA (adenine(2030)-N(6))-methyltransferase RlmJ [Salinimonas profundi]